MRKHNTDECTICGAETTRRAFHDFYDQWENLCHDRQCEKEFFSTCNITFQNEGVQDEA